MGFRGSLLLPLFLPFTSIKHSTGLNPCSLPRDSQDSPTLSWFSHRFHLLWDLVLGLWFWGKHICFLSLSFPICCSSSFPSQQRYLQLLCSVLEMWKVDFSSACCYQMRQRTPILQKGCCKNEQDDGCMDEHVPRCSAVSAFIIIVRQTRKVMTSLWGLFLSQSGPFARIPGSYLKPILFSVQIFFLFSSNLCPIFSFSVQSLTISSNIFVWKLALGRDLWFFFLSFPSFFHALYLVHCPEDSSFAELFNSSLLSWIGDHLCSRLNLCYSRLVSSFLFF